MLTKKKRFKSKFRVFLYLAPRMLWHLLKGDEVQFEVTTEGGDKKNGSKN